MTHTRHTHPQRPRTLPKPDRQPFLYLQPCLFDSQPASPNVQQTERRRRLGHIAQQLPEERFVLLCIHPQTRLRHIVPKRQGSGKLVRTAQQVCLDLRPQYFQRLMVDHEVMPQEKKKPAPPGLRRA